MKTASLDRRVLSLHLHCKFYKKFTAEKKEFIISKQIMRSGTSIGANVREALNGQSKADFIHKLSIAQKECDETIYWLNC